MKRPGVCARPPNGRFRLMDGPPETGRPNVSLIRSFSYCKMISSPAGMISRPGTSNNSARSGSNSVPGAM